MKRQILLLVAIVAISAAIVHAEEKATAGTQPVYVVRVLGDTVWFWGKTSHQSIPYAQFSRDNGTNSISFEDEADTMWISGGIDTTIVAPTTETIRLCFWSKLDTIVQSWPCRLTRPDTLRIALLKKYSSFGTVKPDSSIMFSYKSRDDSELTLLNSRYNLDSICGNGSDFDRSVRLLDWLHRQLKHDGEIVLPDPEPFTTTNILDVSASTHRPFNCYILAFAMSDIYQAAGFTSRTVACMPFDTADHECHQITMLWNGELHKWILMDPSNDCWFADTAGVPLSPLEIRISMAKRDSLRLPDCINHNGVTRDKPDYCNYMAKNLFRLRGWGTRTDPDTGNQQRVEISFEPALYNDHALGQVVTSPASRFPVYYTDNADWFFAPPK
jgi:hypothetical protein